MRVRIEGKMIRSIRVDMADVAVRADMSDPVLCARADMLSDVFNAALVKTGMAICFHMTRYDVMLTRDDVRVVDIRADVSVPFEMKT